MKEAIPVNDGGGLMDSDGMIDSLIVDCNSLTKLLIDNQFIAFGNTLAQMVQKLKLLKDGIRTDMESLQELVDRLQKEAPPDA